jgi:hypothetical protein
MMPKYGEPIDAKRGAGLLRVWDSDADIVACPFIVVRAGGRGETAPRCISTGGGSARDARNLTHSRIDGSHFDGSLRTRRPGTSSVQGTVETGWTMRVAGMPMPQPLAFPTPGESAS